MDAQGLGRTHPLTPTRRLKQHTHAYNPPTPGGKDPSFWPAFEYNAIRGARAFRPGPADLCRRGAPHPGSHSGGTPSFARATDLGLPKTLGRLGKGSVIGFPNPRESSRPAVTTM